MRLLDTLLAARGGMIDTAMRGAITTLGDLLQNAQCFTLSDDVAAICTDVCRSRPSSILGAIDLTRAPYPLTWVEWAPSQRHGAVDNHKPIPRRQGALLVTNNAGSKGYFIQAWVHGQDEVSLNPLALIFDWDSTSAEPVSAQYARMIGLNPASASNRAAALHAEIAAQPLPGRWAHHAASDKERHAVVELELRATLVPLTFCLEFIAAAGIRPGTAPFESYCNDLGGELPFIEAFLLLLNSRNTVVEQTRDDYSRLNRARAKAKKPPLREFINTRIRLSQVQANRAQAIAPGDRRAARAHTVRAHFKVRRSGVYFWNSHLRGQGKLLEREYTVT
jgi:hypothetical protein